MASKRLLTACFAAALLAAGSAQAQFYVRADGAYSKSDRVDFADVGPLGIICGDATCTSGGQFNDFGGGAAVGLGFGTRFAPDGRTDLTFTYRKYKLDQDDKGNPPARFKADLDSLAVMGNLYFEFTEGRGVAPYFGIGAGVAYNKLGDLSFDDGAGFQGSVSGDSKLNFAWGAMFGFGIPLGGRLVLDIAYRYMDLGDVQTIQNRDLTVGGITASYPGATGHLHAHELALGFRF